MPRPLEIREFRRDDISELNQLALQLFPEAPAATDAGFLHWLESHPPRARFRHWVVRVDGDLVGWAFSRFGWTAERDDVAHAWAGVREDTRRRGIGSELFELAERHALDHGARKLVSFAHERTIGQRLLERHGYVHTRSEKFSTLDPREADVSAFPALEAAKAAEGFRLATLGELRDRPRDLHRLYTTVEADMPADDPATNVPYEDWLHETLENPDLDDDASFVALAGDEMVALCLLVVEREGGLAEHENTGTLPAFRRRGLARLVKLASIRWAAENGIREIWTGNDADNPGMLALNQELGYRVRIVRAELAREL